MLEVLELPEIDPLEMDMLLDEWKTCDKQIAKVDDKIAERASFVEPGKILSPAQILMTAPGVGYYSGLTLSSRIGSIDCGVRVRLNRVAVLATVRRAGRSEESLDERAHRNWLKSVDGKADEMVLDQLDQFIHDHKDVFVQA
ncbi:MAG: hypothetical protein KDB27_02190 [Planctomycetales bacterium]|nr:hypothetical protein [Planctomycetales bacterium]